MRRPGSPLSYASASDRASGGNPSDAAMLHRRSIRVLAVKSFIRSAEQDDRLNEGYQGRNESPAKKQVDHSSNRTA